MIQLAKDFVTPAIDQDYFFKTFTGDCKGSDVELRRLFDFIDKSQLVDRTDKAAYILATIRHECGAPMAPRNEMLDDPNTPKDETPWVDESKLRYLKGMDVDYSYHPNTGFIYFGRGYVQLTWYSLYKLFGRVTGLDLVNNPDLLLVPEHAWTVLEIGMFRGLYTGYKMDQFFYEKMSDYYNARKIINPQDYKTYQTVREYAIEFESALRYVG